MKRVWWPTWSSSNSVSRALDDSTNIAAVSKVHNNNNVFHIWLGLAKLISCIRKQRFPKLFFLSSSTDFLLFLTIQKTTTPKTENMLGLFEVIKLAPLTLVLQFLIKQHLLYHCIC